MSYNYTDANSCSAIANRTVNVNLCTGIETELKSSVVSIYPNPANDVIHIAIDPPLINHTTIELYNVTGKLVLTEKMMNENTSIKINFLTKGNYTIKVISDTQQTVGHIIKN
ncbi:MAG: T9SS type A sorting domain-containing protein [Bacteroidetes bacterium]|nr:T9SS type A sorting domain-containing protein [Bacteroidota bacterium]